MFWAESIGEVLIPGELCDTGGQVGVAMTELSEECLWKGLLSGGKCE
jgi:hypothetical protein